MRQQYPARLYSISTSLCYCTSAQNKKVLCKFIHFQFGIKIASSDNHTKPDLANLVDLTRRVAWLQYRHTASTRLALMSRCTCTTLLPDRHKPHQTLMEAFSPASHAYTFLFISLLWLSKHRVTPTIPQTNKNTNFLKPKTMKDPLLH